MKPIQHGHARRLPGGGRVKSSEYCAWKAMKNRCLNRWQDRYKDYGGRGITICERWLNGDGTSSGFACFLADLGPKPTPKHSVERLRNDEGYNPANVVWATQREQARNTRATRLIDICGIRVSLAEAVERWGAVSNVTVRMRLHRGWTPTDALLVPLRGKPGDADCNLWPEETVALSITVVR